MINMYMSGIVGGDAQVRHLPSGDAAISFSLAHTDKWTDKQGNAHKSTVWVNCTIWRKSDKISIAQWIKKGSKVTVSGVPSAQAYLNLSNEPKPSLELRVIEIDLQGGSQNTDQNQQTNNNQDAGTAPVFNSSLSDNDDLPF